MRTVFYIGWIGFGNVGDDLMWDVFRESAGIVPKPQEITLVPSLPGVDLHTVDTYDVVVLGGGSLLIPGYVDVLHHAWKKGKQIAIWGSGADWLTKSDMVTLRASDAEHLHSFPSAEYRRMLKDLFEHAVFAGVRGPLTAMLMKRYGVPSEKLEISGDPGLLLSPDDLPPPLDSCMWQEGEPVIGVNWGTSYNRIFGEREDYVEDRLAEAGRHWIQKGYKLYLYAVWGPDQVPLLRLAEKIGMPDQIRIAPKTYGHYELLRIIRRCHFTVNFKLHGNVMSAAAEVPFVALGYRLKSFDFGASFDLDHYVLPTDDKDLTMHLIHAAENIDQQYSDFIQKLKQFKADYRARLQRPFYEEWGCRSSD